MPFFEARIAATRRLLQSHIALRHLLAEHGAEDAQISGFAAFRHFNGFQIRGFEMPSTPLLSNFAIKTHSSTRWTSLLNRVFQRAASGLLVPERCNCGVQQFHRSLRTIHSRDSVLLA